MTEVNVGDKVQWRSSKRNGKVIHILNDQNPKLVWKDKFPATLPMFSGGRKMSGLLVEVENKNDIGKYKNDSRTKLYMPRIFDLDIIK